MGLLFQTITSLPLPHHLPLRPSTLLRTDKRLHQIRQQGTKEPSAKDILNGLAVKKADIMKQFLEENSSHLNEDDLNSLDAENFQTFLQRKIFPERQAISAEELVTLIQADELARLVESQDLDTNVKAGSREVQD